MSWTRNTLAPVVPLQEAVDGTLMEGVTKLGLQGLLDLGGSGDLPLGSTVEERSKKSVFLSQ